MTVRTGELDMEGVQLLDLYFDTTYAETITSTMNTVIKTLCVGCQLGKLSQKQHECLSLSKKEQLILYFEEILKAVDEEYVLIRWEQNVRREGVASSEQIDFYKLKIYCKDWIESDMKTENWKRKMMKMSLLCIRFENDNQ